MHQRRCQARDLNVNVVLGIVFIIARVVYAVSYVSDPAKRSLGFLLGFIANVALVLGSLYGATKALL